MNFYEIINSEIKAVFSNSMQHCDFYIVQEDGTLLYPRKSSTQSMSIGALVSGVWLASNELAKQIDIQEVISNRLSFDSSNSGIYILPIKSEIKFYYLALIFKNVVNPGQIKNNARMLRDRLLTLDLFLDKKKELNLVKKLFENITDEEVNKLFSNIGM